MLKDQLPVGILKVDYDIALLGEDIASNPIYAIQAVQDKLKDMPKECACIMCMDMINRPICVGFLGYGTGTDVDMSAKEITQFALLCNACGVVVIHNHPSNGKKISDLRPSSDDIKVTKCIAEALHLFGINLNDHIIINCIWEHDTRVPAFYSMRSKSKYKSIFNSEKKLGRGEPAFSGDDIFAGVDKDISGNDKSNNEDVTIDKD